MLTEDLGSVPFAQHEGRGWGMLLRAEGSVGFRGSSSCRCGAGLCWGFPCRQEGEANLPGRLDLAAVRAVLAALPTWCGCEFEPRKWRL